MVLLENQQNRQTCKYSQQHWKRTFPLKGSWEHLKGGLGPDRTSLQCSIGLYFHSNISVDRIENEHISECDQFDSSFTKNPLLCSQQTTPCAKIHNFYECRKHFSYPSLLNQNTDPAVWEVESMFNETTQTVSLSRIRNNYQDSSVGEKTYECFETHKNFNYGSSHSKHIPFPENLYKGAGKWFIRAKRIFRAPISKTRLTNPKNAFRLLVKTQTLQDTRKFIVQRNPTNVTNVVRL